MALLIFCLEDLSTDVRGVLKVNYYYCLSVSFSLYVYWYLLYVFRCSYIGCIYVNEGKFSSCFDPLIII